MSQNNNVNSGSHTEDAPTFLTRVLAHDSFRKGVATAAVGTLIAIVTEAVWSSKS